MNRNTSKVHKITLTAILMAIILLMQYTPLGYLHAGPVEITFITIPVVIGAIVLGPWYGVGVAFAASLLRNLLGLGTLLAFPGSMCGALLCGVVYWKTRRLLPTLVAEVFGTAILGGLCAYPMAILFMGANAAQVAFYAYIIPFLVSTAGGAILSGVILFSLDKAGALKGMQQNLCR